MNLIPAFVLHRRPFRDTSLIVELFTLNHGRITLVARGVKRPKSPLSACLQPFVPLCVNWYGRGEMATLKCAEARLPILRLNARANNCGFYLNELLIKTIARADPHPNLFELYEKTLIALHELKAPTPLLRHFECILLRELGYGLSFDEEGITHQAIEPQNHYEWKHELGFIKTNPLNNSTKLVFSGNDLLLLAQGNYNIEKPARLKVLIQTIFKEQLGIKEFHSRELFLTAMDDPKEFA